MNTDEKKNSAALVQLQLEIAKERRAKELSDALDRLQLECIHYRNTGRGKQFLRQALNNAQLALDCTQ